MPRFSVARPLRGGMDVTVYGPLRGVTGEKTVEVAFAGGRVRDAIDAFVDAYPRARTQLVDEEGELRASVRVHMAGEKTAPDEPCQANASLALYPAMRGG